MKIFSLKKRIPLIILFTVWLPLISQTPSLLVEDGKLIYNVDSLGNRVLDFSYCGYKNSNEDIPLVENVIFIPIQKGDASEVIQQGIDYVENLPLNESGFRGAVLLDKGVFTLDNSLSISKSGVVLRGVGKSETILRKRGVDRNTFIKIEGIDDLEYLDTLSITTNYIPVNSRLIDVSDTHKLKESEYVMIFRPSTSEWIEKMGCNHFGGDITYLGWKAGEMDIYWDRKITQINDDVIHIDAPLTMALDLNEATSKVITYNWPGRISNVGVENLSLESEYDIKFPNDEDHSWTGVSVENATNCWIRHVNFKSFAGSAVIIQPTGSKVTVEDCISTAPASEIGGMRRNTFLTMGQLNLFQRCYSEEGIHDFAAGYCAPGPNAFVQCETKNSYSYSGAIDSWACGLLFDIVNIDGNNLVFKNLGQDTNGAGWATSNSLFWQSTASEIECYSPNTENKNRAYGCWGQFSGNGEWFQSNNHVNPRSFFYAQLSDRLNGDFMQRARILPLNIFGSTSPTIELAKRLTEEASIPKLTLKEWIEDSLSLVIPYDKNLFSINDLEKSDKSRRNEIKHTIEVINGKISFDNRLLTGGKIEVPWWSGKLRSSFIEKAKPHITRFVPGREGLGLTDRIDSVITYMQGNNLSVLDHNYGLWYDRRRDDHQRVRRRDGDVWGPFYEQPFARSGEGLAWDGLTKYDLTKPNLWYWSRLKEFANKASDKGILLFHENYFQHNILEAGAHWVDSPWRTANNINSTGFLEPVPFAGDKRIFVAESFYDVNNEDRRELHRTYIRQCLNAFADNDNVVQLTSSEFTGPLHFVQFWIDEINKWKEETGKSALVALSTTKDVQDAILSDPERSEIVDIIDIRYWHYKNDGTLYAPEGNKNLSPRQHARQMKVGKISFREVYKAVSEYRNKYTDKAVTYYAHNYPNMGWAVFMGGGSVSSIPVKDPSFLRDALLMNVDNNNSDKQDFYKLENPNIGAIIYINNGLTSVSIPLKSATYQLRSVDKKSGEISIEKDSIDVENVYTLNLSKDDNKIYWFKRRL